MAYNNGGNSWEQIQLGIRETKQLLDRNEYNLCMIKARQTLELMVSYLAGHAGIPGGDLVDAIDKLTEIRMISAVSGEHYHGIRMLGNRAVHESYGDPQQAQQAYRLLLDEVRTFGNEYLPRTMQDPGPQRRLSRGAEISVPRAAAQNIKVDREPTARARDSHREDFRREELPRGNRREEPRRQSGSRAGYEEGGGRRSASSRPVRTSDPDARSRRRPAGSKRPKQGITPAQLIKIGIALVVILLALLAAIHFAKGAGWGGKADPTQDTTAPTETVPEMTTQAPTLPPETEPSEPEETSEPESPAAQTYKSTADALNLRSEAATTASILVVIPQGAEVEYVREHDDEWAVVRYDGKEGYVASRFITPSGGGSQAASTAAQQ